VASIFDSQPQLLQSAHALHAQTSTIMGTQWQFLHKVRITAAPRASQPSKSAASLRMQPFSVLPCIGPWEVPSPRGLWSLWDMLKVHALEFFRLGERSSAVRWDVFWLSDTAGTGQNRKLREDEKEKLKIGIMELSDLCKKIGLTTSLELLRDRENDLPQTTREWEVLVAAVTCCIGAHVP
jgi:hypothetical protein